MVARLTFAECAWKIVWRKHIGASQSLYGIGTGIGAFVAMVGFSCGLESGWLNPYEPSGIDAAVERTTLMGILEGRRAELILPASAQVAEVSPEIRSATALPANAWRTRWCRIALLHFDLNQPQVQGEE